MLEVSEDARLRFTFYGFEEHRARCRLRYLAVGEISTCNQSVSALKEAKGVRFDLGVEGEHGCLCRCRLVDKCRVPLATLGFGAELSISDYLGSL